MNWPIDAVDGIDSQRSGTRFGDISKYGYFVIPLTYAHK